MQFPPLSSLNSTQPGSCDVCGRSSKSAGCIHAGPADIQREKGHEQSWIVNVGTPVCGRSQLTPPVPCPVAGSVAESAPPTPHSCCWVEGMARCAQEGRRCQGGEWRSLMAGLQRGPGPVLGNEAVHSISTGLLHAGHCWCVGYIGKPHRGPCPQGAHIPVGHLDNKQ